MVEGRLNRGQAANYWWELPLVCLVLLGLAVLSTYPLILHFDTALPYAPFGGPKAWNRSGDQVQLLYWFWLVKENLIGAVPFDSNPFEFNMVAAHESTGLNTIPLAFFYILFSPLGDIAAYNCTVFSSYLLAGLFMYLLVRLYSGSRTGALLGAVIFTFAPSRINGLAGGHGYGFLYFCYPFILFFLEKGIRSEKVRWGVFAAAGFLFLAMLEPHLTYYICVFLGGYIPFRMITLLPVNRESSAFASEKRAVSLPSALAMLIIWGAGAAAVIYAHALFTCRDQDLLYSSTFWWSIAAYPLIPLLISICLAGLLQRLAPLSFRESLSVEAWSMVPLFLLLPLAAFSCFVHVQPVDTYFLLISALVLIIAVKLLLLRRCLRVMLRTLIDGIKREKKKNLPVLPVVLTMAGVVVWIGYSKVHTIAATIAGAGRSLRDVGIYSARLSDLFVSTSNVYVGIVPAVIGASLLPVLLWYSSVVNSRQDRYAGQPVLLCLFYVLAWVCGLILALGLAFGKSSLYILFYHYFPFFNYPRVSDRMITMVLFSMAICAGFAVHTLQQRCRSRLCSGGLVLLVFISAGIQLMDYNILKPMGITVMDRGQDIYTHVKENIGDGLLLEIPLWPGDSHQSSLYEHYIMLDRVRRVNGASPLVLQEYIDTVFEPLSSLNQGRLDRKQYELLQEMGVRYITVHDNRDVFLDKVSPFGPLTTVRRLKNSPYLEFIDIDNKMYFKNFTKNNDHLYLFRLRSREAVEEVGEEAAWYGMPYFYYVHSRLHKHIGSVAEDEGTGREVFQAIEGRDTPGFLVYGPYDLYPPGDYRCYFTLSADGGTDDTVATVDVARVPDNGELDILAKAEIHGKQGPQQYRKVYLDFSITQPEKLEFRVFFHGRGELRVEKIGVSAAGNDQPLTFLEAEKMVGETGELLFLAEASGGKVVEARVGRSRKGYLIYGPNRIYPAGRYTARFFLRGRDGKKNGGNECAALLSVTDGQHLTVFGERKVAVEELAGSSFTPFAVDFTIPRAEELSFRAGFTGKATLQLDGIEVVTR